MESRSGGVDVHVEVSGDPAPAVLRHHCVAYRVFVRAEIACLRHPQDDRDAAADAARDADLALRHLESGAVRLAGAGEHR